VTVIVEQRLRFDFGRSWQVEKYDGHHAYREGIQRLQGTSLCETCLEHSRCPKCKTELGVGSKAVGTKAVDIVGRYQGQLYLIEVKDFRRHRIENKRRVRDGELAFEVGLKVRDTLAGLLGALHRRDAGDWSPLVAPIFERAPTVLLWLEEDLDEERVAQRGHPALTVTDELRPRLRWLTSDVRVLNTRKLPPKLDLSVSNIADRVYKLRKLVDERTQRRTHVSIDDFCDAWTVTRQEAGTELPKFLAADFLCREGKSDRFAAGPRWDHFHEEPA
jgi:hypothetical protein